MEDNTEAHLNILARLTPAQMQWVNTVAAKGGLSKSRVFKLLVERAMNEKPEAFMAQLEAARKAAELNEIRDEMKRLEQRRRELESGRAG